MSRLRGINEKNIKIYKLLFFSEFKMDKKFVHKPSNISVDYEMGYNLGKKEALEDEIARDVLRKHETKIDTINERTKSHTWEIKELNKRLLELENKK